MDTSNIARLMANPRPFGVTGQSLSREIKDCSDFLMF